MAFCGILTLRRSLLAFLLLSGLLLLYNAATVVQSHHGFVHGRQNSLMAKLKAVVVHAGENSSTPRAADAAPSNAKQQQDLVIRSQLEEIRREAAGDLRAMNVFLQHHLEEIANNTTDLEAAAHLKAVLAEAEDRYRVTQLDLSKLDDLAGLSAWREREAVALSQEVQQRLHAHQHPANCITAKKLMCQGDRYAGFGSVMYDVIKCLMAAYSTGRVMVLHGQKQNRITNYWEDIFLPPSPPSCRNLTSKMIRWPATSETEAVYFPASYGLTPPPPLWLHDIPRDIASRLLKFSDQPGAWWVGQSAGYLMRLTLSMQQKIDAIKKKLKYGHPIVGVHVRRTDKKKEARYQPLEKYMKQVENYYLRIDLASPSAPPTSRRVFLATEEPSVVREAKRKYPTYEFLWNPNKAERVISRSSRSGFMDIVADIYLLAQADYLVCTFTSNVGRLAFEWMSYFRPDAASRVASLDAVYHFYSLKQKHSIRFPHKPDKSARSRGFKEVKVGDQVISSYKTMDQGGYRNVHVPKGKEKGWGLLPDYKLQDLVNVVNVTFFR